MYDTLLRNAVIIDGSGTGRYPADLGIEGERIAAIGDLSKFPARQVIDVGGHVVAPGFIDAHTHDDAALLSLDGMTPKLTQGVTTVITGNCGISLAPLLGGDSLPAPFGLLGGAGNFVFDRIDSYKAELVRRGTDTNSAFLVGHSTLRQRVMSDLNRAANEREIEQMQAQIEIAMREGAFGFSSGLDYSVSAAASTGEIKALADVAARFGGHYVTHLRNYFDRLEESIEEAIDIARAARGKLIISHHQVTGRRNFGKSIATLQRFAAARREIPVAVDAYPYAATSTVLRLDRCDLGVRILITWSKPHPELAGLELADIAQRWRCSERQAAERLLPSGAVYYQLDETDVRCILQDPHTMIGSDGLPHDDHPHPRLWGTFPRVLGHYARDLGLFSLEEAVFRMTGLTADEFGIAERGRLVPGALADIVVFDPELVADRATFESPRCPASGIEWVFVNGAAAVAAGRRTGCRNGRVLRPRRLP